MSWLKEDSKELYDQQIGYIISYTFSLMRPYRFRMFGKLRCAARNGFVFSY